MQVTRRDAFRLAAGALCSAVTTAIVPAETALAVIGIDDAVLGGVVLAMLTLAGYAVSAKVSQATLQAMGYSFSDFCSDSANQAAAVTQAIADANNLGVQINRQNAEDAAAVIASGTGAFADWISGVAATGRATIDGWLGGIGANQAALWGLVSQFAQTVLNAYPTVGGDAVSTGNTSVTAASLGLSFRALPLADMMDFLGNPSLDVTPTWMMWRPILPSTGKPYNIWYGDGPVMYFTSATGSDVYWTATGNKYQAEYQGAPPTLRSSRLTGSMVIYPKSYGTPIVSDNVFSGSMLPGVDRAPDAPAVIGPGYDKTILGNDMVVGQDGTIVSPGSIAVPIQLPVVDVPYSDALYGNQAGVIQGLLDVPISGTETVTVGTGEGVQAMPVSQAIATSTSISPSTPVDPGYPNVPPGTPDVGPWTPAYSIPFMDVWPFNMIYTFVDTLSALGGS